MNRKTTVAFAVSSSLRATPAAPFAHGVQQTEAIASSDVLSRIPLNKLQKGPEVGPPLQRHPDCSDRTE
jgi:hypothetical protein